MPATTTRPRGDDDPPGAAAHRLALRLLDAAGSSGRAPLAARALLEVVHDDPAVRASAVDVVEPDGHVRSWWSVGYRPATLDHLHSPAFRHRDPGYRLLCEQPERPTRCWEDVPDYEASYSVTRVFRPAGYSGGATTRLVTADGRHVGDLHLSCVDGAPRSDLLDGLRLASRTLAALMDRAGMAEHQVTVDAAPARPTPAPHGPSIREIEVLGLVAAGLTNRAIARRLGLSERTVAHHVEHTMTKLGVASRSAAVATAIVDGLLPGPTLP